MQYAIDGFLSPFKFKMYMSEEYEISTEKTNRYDIVLGNDAFRVYSYSNDYREPSVREEKFCSFKEVVEYCVNLQVTIGVRNSMAKDKSRKLIRRVMTSEESKEEIEFHNRHNDLFNKSLSSYLNRFITRFYLSQIERMAKNA